MNGPMVGFSKWDQALAGHLHIHVGQEGHREGTGGVTVKAHPNRLYSAGPLTRLRPAFPQATLQATQDAQATLTAPPTSLGPRNPLLSPQKATPPARP